MVFLTKPISYLFKITFRYILRSFFDGLSWYICLNCYFSCGFYRPSSHEHSLLLAPSACIRNHVNSGSRVHVVVVLFVFINEVGESRRLSPASADTAALCSLLLVDLILRNSSKDGVGN